MYSSCAKCRKPKPNYYKGICADCYLEKIKKEDEYEYQKRTNNKS